MCSASISFKWLDILEKEFDKAFVNIDLLLGEFDGEESDVLHVIRKKLATMCSCFSQLSHKALTIFQMNCKAEAEIINLKSEVIEMKIQNQFLEKEVHSLLIQLHSNQLEHLNLSFSEQKENIKDKLQRDLAQCSPVRSSLNELETTIFSLENWKLRLQTENELLRSTIVSLQAEVCGARLAARYLDKELAGRIQQLQLLTRDDMNLEIKNKLWNQLDAEILLQRHKTVIKVMRQQKNHSTPPEDIAGRIRNVYLNREPSKGLGISVTGGREHGVPILISDLGAESSKKNLFVGDAILSVNGIDLNPLTHKDAVEVLSNQFGNIILTVITLSTVNINELEEETNIPSYLSYPFFEETDGGDVVNVTSESNIFTGSQTSPMYSSKNIKTSSEKIAENLKPNDVPPENELFGVTSLQNIFRNVSSIQSNKKDTVFLPKSLICKRNSSDNCCSTSHSNHKKYNFNYSNEASNNLNRADHSNHVPTICSSNISSDKHLYSKVTGGIGDSSVGTPV